MARTNGPGEYLAKNPIAYVLSLFGAGTAVGAFAFRAAGSRGPKRLGWVLLCALEMAIFLGIIVVTEGANPRNSRRRWHRSSGGDE